MVGHRTYHSQIAGSSPGWGQPHIVACPVCLCHQSHYPPKIVYSRSAARIRNPVVMYFYLTFKLRYTCMQVADITFTFWNELSDVLYEMNKQPLIEVFKPYLQRLVMALCRHCRYPPTQVVNQSSCCSYFLLFVRPPDIVCRRTYILPVFLSSFFLLSFFLSFFFFAA